MRLSNKVVKKILGVDRDVVLEPKNMARRLKATFFPFNSRKVEKKLIKFRSRLEASLIKLGVSVIPFEKALVDIGAGMGRKIKKGIVVFATSECETGNFPIDYFQNFRDNITVSILGWPSSSINESSCFKEHLKVMNQLFSWNMSNSVICTDNKKWLLYSLNASYPIYNIDKDFDCNILNTLITKCAAPVSAPRISEFIVKREKSIIKQKDISFFMNDLVESGPLFALTELYPEPAAINKLKTRNKYYKEIISRFVDKRSGMSYGFLARQLPVRLKKPVSINKARREFGIKLSGHEKYFIYKNQLYVLMKFKKDAYYINIPDVWVLTSKSGADKTNLNINRDIIKMGLVNGKMVMEVPANFKDLDDYRPSYDSRVILAHAVANATYASILASQKADAIFPKILEQSGMALAHWHGYLLPEFIPKGWKVHGQHNPPVSCSSLQAAIYAFRGKERAIMDNLSEETDYLGDIHFEPQHGTNISWPSLKGLAHYLLSSAYVSKLGNEYLKLYK